MRVKGLFSKPATLSSERQMVILKLGGSLLTLPDLAARIEAVLQQRTDARVAILVGGGAAADVVREWDRTHALGEDAAHQLALQAMRLTAAFVAGCVPHARVVGDDDALSAAWSAGALPLLSADAWLARAEAEGRTTVPHTWDATSDSIAAWLATELAADELVLLKSIDCPRGTMPQAADEGVVDACFPDAAAGLPRISWVNLRSDRCRIESWVREQAFRLATSVATTACAAWVKAHATDGDWERVPYTGTPMANVDRDWDARYADGDLPWDSGLPSRELVRVLSEARIESCRALELGCGTGTNAVELARRGFDVTAVDCASRAIDVAREKAAAAGVNVNWIVADVQNFGAGLTPFDFVFDRGCYHCCRRVDFAGYAATLANVTRPGTRMLCLTGHPDAAPEHRIPRVTEQELLDEFGPMFEFEFRRPFHFEDAGGIEGPLGWSVLLRRCTGSKEQRDRGETNG